MQRTKSRVALLPLGSWAASPQLPATPGARPAIKLSNISASCRTRNLQPALPEGLCRRCVNCRTAGAAGVQIAGRWYASFVGLGQAAPVPGTVPAEARPRTRWRRNHRLGSRVRRSSSTLDKSPAYRPRRCPHCVRGPQSCPQDHFVSAGLNQFEHTMIDRIPGRCACNKQKLWIHPWRTIQ